MLSTEKGDVISGLPSTKRPASGTAVDPEVIIAPLIIEAEEYICSERIFDHSLLCIPSWEPSLCAFGTNIDIFFSFNLLCFI